MDILRSTGTALDTILTYKLDEVARAKSATPLSLLKTQAESAPHPRGFVASLDTVAATGENALICELKRKSPSAGEILPGADPVAIATEYEAGGAACLSILTDGPSFGGNLEDLEAIRTAVALPLLRKDFMVDPWQVIEARAHGADAILVILAAVDDALAYALCDTAIEYGMDILAEVHNAHELHRARALPVRLMGVNNRNLKTMTTDLVVTETLAPLIPPDMALVSESGVADEADIIRLRDTGARRFLVGESLMKQPSRADTVQTLRKAGTN
ncbi:MAG: indole-3-glycerol phosphate synthase TrpC [Pseudomonadota bacterium]